MPVQYCIGGYLRARFPQARTDMLSNTQRDTHERTPLVDGLSDWRKTGQSDIFSALTFPPSLSTSAHFQQNRCINIDSHHTPSRHEIRNPPPRHLRRRRSRPEWHRGPLYSRSRLRVQRDLRKRKRRQLPDLAASLSGSNGPSCYLINSTTLTTTLNLTIPPVVGPSAGYYSIAISDLTTAQGATYSNLFNLTRANGTYTSYENQLHGSPFWSAKDLPCESYKCARECAMKYYPEDLKETDSYEKMRDCIVHCDGVTPAANQTMPAQAASTSTEEEEEEEASSTSTSEETSSTESGAAETSSGAANRQVYAAGAAAAGFGALAFLL